jgi:hypothetical protein
MDEIKALAADLGWLSRYRKPQTLLYLATFEHACASKIAPRDARAIYAAFAGRDLASSGSDAVQVSKLRTMTGLADHPHSLRLRRVLKDVIAIMGAGAPARGARAESVLWLRLPRLARPGGDVLPLRPALS